jgi:hypothetical protein
MPYADRTTVPVDRTKAQIEQTLTATVPTVSLISSSPRSP